MSTMPGRINIEVKYTRSDLLSSFLTCGFVVTITNYSEQDILLKIIKNLNLKIKLTFLLLNISLKTFKILNRKEMCKSDL